MLILVATLTVMVITMGCKTIVEQLADALGTNSVSNTDTIAIVVNNTLYRVTVADFITAMGLSGAITGINGGSATPILKGTAPNYEIRGIVGASGITCSVNGNDSVDIAASLANAGGSGDGSEVIVNPASSTIAFRRIKAGNGIQITQESNRLIIDNTEVAVTNQTVIVSELSDFPTAVSGVITLQDDKDYLVVNNITTSNRFVLGSNTVLRAVDPYTVTLGYTGTGNMFTCVDGNQSIKEIQINCPNGSFADSNNTTGNLLLRWIRFAAVKNMGNLDKQIIGIYNLFLTLFTGSGFTTDSLVSARLTVQNVTCLQSTGSGMTFIDLNGSTYNSLDIENVSFLNTISGQTFLSGSAAGANLTAGTIGFLSKLNIQGDMAALDTISSNDAGWDFTDCNKIKDTDPHGLTYLSAPATTTIVAASTPVIVNGTFTEKEVQVYETNSNGRVTYKGRRDKFARIDITIALEPSSGTNKNIEVSIFKNGTKITETAVVRVISAGSAGIVSIDWAETLQTNDFIEVAVANNTDTVNVQVNQLLLRVA